MNVSNHAMTRYAERIAGRDEKIDINIYVQQNREKIVDDVNKMCNHSEFIYSGRFGNKDNTAVNVYLSGTWVILTDLNNTKVITLYKVEFNVGEDFNKQFISKILEKLAKDKEILENQKAKIANEKAAYEQIIADNNETIKEYRGIIKMLERSNADYTDVIANINAECLAAEMAVKRDVENLAMRKEF